MQVLTFPNMLAGNTGPPIMPPKIESTPTNCTQRRSRSHEQAHLRIEWTRGLGDWAGLYGDVRFLWIGRRGRGDRHAPARARAGMQLPRHGAAGRADDQRAA